MRSRKNQQQTTGKTPDEGTNGDAVRQALDWIVNDEIFAGVVLHGNVISWTVSTLVYVAVFWMWSEKSALGKAAGDAIKIVWRIFGCKGINSYQSLTNALRRYGGQILPILQARMHGLMEQCDKTAFRVGAWLVLAVDGSRVNVPRTRKNEQAFCKPATKKRRKKTSKKKRGRHARKKPPTRKKKHYDPQPVGPQMWLTLIWHLGQRMPWCWKTGPSYSSERDHVRDMLETRTFPENTLFCGDAGFVGYDFWNAIVKQKHDFIARVGGNVHLLRKLNLGRESHGTVYCWPDAAMNKKKPPLQLRLLHFKDARNRSTYLVTSVLDEKRLSDKQIGDIYRRRWGIEVQFRSLKQTYGRTKLRSRTSENATVELDWSLLSLWMLQLLAHKEQVPIREPDQSTSIADILRIMRETMLREWDVPDHHESLQQQLSKATTDNYDRPSKKKSRNYPRRKEEPAPGKPKIKTATREHKQRLKTLAIAA